MRIERVGGAARGKDLQDLNEAVEFEGPGVWAAASFVVSQGFGLSPPLLTADPAMFAVIRAAARAPVRSIRRSLSLARPASAKNCWCI